MLAREKAADNIFCSYFKDGKLDAQWVIYTDRLVLK